MIEIKKRTFNITLALIIGLIVLVLSLTSTNYKMSQEHQVSIETATTLNKQLKDSTNILESRVLGLQKMIDQQSHIYNQIERVKDSVSSHYEGVISSLKSNPDIVQHVIDIETKGDSLVMATKLLERIKCLQENKLIIEQNEILQTKTLLMDTVIRNQESSIIIKDKIIANNEVIINTHVKNEKRLERKLKAQKIINKVVIIGAIAGGIILSL